ncbi:hypothetical protein ACJX0J_006775, partial [Zea mays]
MGNVLHIQLHLIHGLYKLYHVFLMASWQCFLVREVELLILNLIAILCIFVSLVPCICMTETNNFIILKYRYWRISILDCGTRIIHDRRCRDKKIMDSALHDEDDIVTIE